MVKKSNKKWFDMPIDCYCGVFVDAPTMKKLQKLLWKQTQELKEFLEANKDGLLTSSWTLAHPNGKQTIVYYSDNSYNLSDRIDLLDKANRIEYVKNGVFISDKCYIEARDEVEDFYNEHYS